MKRGDVVIVAAAGDYGKPRRAVLVQTDAFPGTHPSVVICQMTSDVVDAQDFRVTIEPNDRNGLRTRSQVMVDKPVTVRRERIGQTVGRLTDSDIGRLNIALAFVLGSRTEGRSKSYRVDAVLVQRSPPIVSYSIVPRPLSRPGHFA